MNAWMGGWVDEWINGWMDKKLVDGWVRDGWVGG